MVRVYSRKVGANKVGASQIEVKETMGELDRWQRYRDAGFEVVILQDSVKLVRGLCELHVCSALEATLPEFDIPVVRIDRQSGIPKELQEYLENRNERHGGPGTFRIEGDTVWYKAQGTHAEPPEKTALKAQKAVESIGPRILNLLK